ncbi:MAG: hypothetical protein R3A52_27405 [Polyangiales bacterium]
MRRLLLPLACLSIAAGCSESASTVPDASTVDVPTNTDVITPSDGATDAAVDAAPDPCEGEPAPREALRPTRLYLAPGARASVQVLLGRDRCSPLTLPVSSASATVATAGATSVAFVPGQATGSIEVTAVAQGETTVNVGNASVTVVVAPAGLPACPTGTAPATGTLMAGGEVRGATGTPLAQASVSLDARSTIVPATPVTVRCAEPLTLSGFTAISPAVRFDPAATRMIREARFTLPVDPTRVPSGYELQIELAYLSPGSSTPRVVPAADVHLTDDGRAVSFRAPRLGTWQAVVRDQLGARRRTRRFTYHAILGVSMGSAGAGMIGLRNPDRFDFVAPMGGPVDWNYLSHYIRTYHVAGFCTAAERAMNPSACEMGASVDRTPPVTDLFERRQTFEEWFFPDGTDGQGGNFDRYSYIQIFRDLTRMFGNAIVPSGMTGILPRGVPDTELTRSDSDRCSMPVTLMGWYDRRYNPDGSIPVVTFCDGQHAPNRQGLWDGGRGNFPMEVTLAVDVNRNGRRDRGEPVLEQFYEPFSDVGPDGVPSSMEPGYDPVTNPDPAGDDYDRQFNPAGTEGNYTRDEGEPFEDVGVDGVVCPTGQTCPYDVGEGNGRWDQNPGLARFLEVNPRRLVATMPAASLERLNIWADGGASDLFMFGTVSNHFVGGVAQRGQPVHYFNNFSPLGAERVSETSFPYDTIDWARVPSTVMLRYGQADPTSTEYLAGDGAHVGTIAQITNRLYSSLFWMSARWPGGDRRPARYSTEADNAGRCATGHFCTFDFTSERANRTGPVSVYLPPGYHDPENANVRYPVVYFLHGYGQQPQDLVATGLIVGNFMSSANLPSWRRPQKFIMVFPDGRCRPQDNCLRGTFYTDSTVGGAQMETYFLDLYDYIDRSYRVRMPEDVEVTE